MKNTPTLYTEHLTLDRFTLEDVPAVRDGLYSEAVCRNLFITPNKTTEEVTENIQWLLDGYETKEDFHQWAVRENGLCVGRVMLSVNRRFSTGTVAYYLAESAWGKGYMTEALRAVIQYGFDGLNLNRIEAQHETTNPASGAVMRKCHMQHEGTLRSRLFNKGRYVDVELYAILRKEYEHRKK